MSNDISQRYFKLRENEFLKFESRCSFMVRNWNVRQGIVRITSQRIVLGSMSRIWNVTLIGLLWGAMFSKHLRTKIEIPLKQIVSASDSNFGRSKMIDIADNAGKKFRFGGKIRLDANQLMQMLKTN